MELKGKIEKGEELYLTCCTTLQDVIVGGKSVYETLENIFNLDSAKEFNYDEEDSNQLDKEVSLRMIIQDTQFSDKKFNELATDIVMATIIGEYISGCYTEYTCGYGAFTYLLKDTNHDIFKTLLEHEGKYVYIKF